MKKSIIVITALFLALSVFQVIPTYQASLQAQEDVGPRAGGTIEMGQSVNGSIAYTTPFERWTFQGAQGQLVIITMGTSAGNLDPYLELLDPSGAREAFDKDTGPGKAARISTRLLKTGQYTILAKDVDSFTIGNYVLRLTDPAHLPNLASGQSVKASIQQAAFSDLYTFLGTAGGGIILTVDSVGGLGLPYLELLNRNGMLIASTSTTTCSPGVNQAMLRALPDDGPYVVAVYDYWGITPGSYSLILSTYSATDAGAPTATASPAPPPTATPTTPAATPAVTSTPTPAPTTVAEALKSIEGKYTTIFNFDNATGVWRYYNAANPAAATITRLEPWQSYWINVTEDVTLVVGDASIPLYKGWNQVGWR
ncbi:MAG: hypothetical protein HYX92_02330 [Chloroflexi bacterium]|nr:hypothetical protein [Chloroflexota bacterium]